MPLSYCYREIHVHKKEKKLYFRLKLFVFFFPAYLRISVSCFMSCPRRDLATKFRSLCVAKSISYIERLVTKCFRFGQNF